MSSPKSRQHSPSCEEELWVLRSQLEAGQIVMTRALLLRVVEEGLNPSAFDSGVNLFVYYDKDIDEAARRKDQFEEAFDESQKFEEWRDSWYRCARPEWLDVMGDILIEPPLGWMLDEEFAELFLNVAGQFPDRAVQVLAVLFSDQKVHPRLASLIQALYVKWFN